MPARQRLDGYGAPLPALTDARQQSLRTSATNQGQQQRLWALLDEVYATLLHRGTYAQVTLTLYVEDGTLQREITLTTTQQYGRRDDSG
jgi:hypothetical protein